MADLPSGKEMMEGSRTSSGSEKLYIYGTYPRFGSGGGEDCIAGGQTRWPSWGFRTLSSLAPSFAVDKDDERKWLMMVHGQIWRSRLIDICRAWLNEARPMCRGGRDAKTRAMAAIYHRPLMCKVEVGVR